MSKTLRRGCTWLIWWAEQFRLWEGGEGGWTPNCSQRHRRASPVQAASKILRREWHTSSISLFFGLAFPMNQGTLLSEMQSSSWSLPAVSHKASGQQKWHGDFHTKPCRLPQAGAARADWEGARAPGASSFLSRACNFGASRLTFRNESDNKNNYLL